MRRRAFVRLGRLSVPAKYRKQRGKRQDDQDFAANAVDLLPTHGVTSFPACPHFSSSARTSVASMMPLICGGRDTLQVQVVGYFEFLNVPSAKPMTAPKVAKAQCFSCGLKRAEKIISIAINERPMGRRM
jgi:hypothetical protein